VFTIVCGKALIEYPGKNERKKGSQIGRNTFGLQALLS